jgi:hypoxanthine phosphoribosyltransferase
MHLSVGSESVSRDSSLSLLIPADKLQVRIREMGAEITRDYAGRQIRLVGLFESSRVFLRDLVRATELQLAVDFIASDSRGDGASTHHAVSITRDLNVPVAGRETILVVALLNAGLPLSDFTRYLRSRGAASVEVAALLCKPGSHQAGSEAAYRGFDIPDYFVAGYGLQYAGRYGDLPYIAVIRDQVRLRGDQSHLDHRVRRIVKLLEEQCLCPPIYLN